MSALPDQVRQTLRQRHDSYRTEESYVYGMRQDIFFHGIRHPQEMGGEEIAAFLTHLAVHKHIAPSTQNQAPSALLFLYQQVMDIELPPIGETLARQKPERVPVGFTHPEVQEIMARLRVKDLIRLHIATRQKFRVTALAVSGTTTHG